jgi:ATP-dependent Clp protease protease subunit
MTYTQIDGNTGEMKIYGHISEWWNSAEEFTTVFEEMESKFNNIRIRMHCFGGSVFEGTVIFNAITKSRANVTIIVEGIAASMGSIILQAGKKRIIADNAFVMIHRPTGYTQGDSETHFNAGKMLQAMEKNFAKTYARRSGKPEGDVKKYLDGNDHWLSAEEAGSEWLYFVV